MVGNVAATPIPGFPEYGMTKEGRVWVFPRVDDRGRQFGSRYIRPWANKSGHLRVEIGQGNARVREYIHRLMLVTFRGPCPEGCGCRHLDGNPANNQIGNLVWGTQQENVHDAMKHGTFKSPPIKKGVDNNQSKLTEKSVRQIRRRKQDGDTIYELAECFGVSPPAIGYVINRKTWAHVI